MTRRCQRDSQTSCEPADQSVATCARRKDRGSVGFVAFRGTRARAGARDATSQLPDIAVNASATCEREL